MSRAFERHWERACAYLHRQQVDAARVQLESMRALAPRDVRNGLLSAQLAWSDDAVRSAAAWALDAAASAPDDPVVLCDVIDILLQTGETATARRLLERPVLGPDAPIAAQLRCAMALQALGENALALPWFDRLVASQPGDVGVRFCRGQALADLRRTDDAEGDYAACLARAPDCGQAANRLVRLRSQATRPRHLEWIERGLALPALGPLARIAFEFAAYHVHEDCGDYDEAWFALERGNALMRAWTRATAGAQGQALKDLLGDLADWTPTTGAPRTGPSPIFIVGLPHAGAEFLAYLLGSHPDVAVAGPLDDFGQQLLRVADTRSIHGGVFRERVRTLDLADVGRRYLAQTAWRARGKACLVDSQPANWMVAGLVHAALPRARILHVLRDPLDAAFANYRTLASGADTWSHDFATLAEHHGDCRRLMRHWHDVLPGVVMDVVYEDLLRAPRDMLRKVLAFCGLETAAPREDGAARAGDAARIPPQMELPGTWRHYAAQLEPLRQLLQVPAPATP